MSVRNLAAILSWPPCVKKLCLLLPHRSFVFANLTISFRDISLALWQLCDLPTWVRWPWQMFYTLYGNCHKDITILMIYHICWVIHPIITLGINLMSRKRWLSLIEIKANKLNWMIRMNNSFYHYKNKWHMFHMIMDVKVSAYRYNNYH